MGITCLIDNYDITKLLFTTSFCLNWTLVWYKLIALLDCYGIYSTFRNNLLLIGVYFQTSPHCLQNFPAYNRLISRIYHKTYHLLYLFIKPQSRMSQIIISCFVCFSSYNVTLFLDYHRASYPRFSPVSSHSNADCATPTGHPTSGLSTTLPIKFSLWQVYILQ